MTGEKDAPAEMPTREQVEAEILPMTYDGADLTECVERVMALFAPILAEKERDNRQLKLEVAAERETSRISIYGWRDKENEMEARALAAEAALAAERERAAQIGYRVCAETRHVTLGDKVAAAIRAEGE